MAGGFLGTIAGQVRLDIRQAVAAYATIRAQNARTVYALRGTGDSFVQAGQTMATTGGILVYAFSRAVKAAADFERKMDFFGAVTNTNAEGMKKLSKFTLQLAQDTIYSAEQIADGFIELGKAGVGATEIIDGIGVAMSNLGAAADIDLATSGQIITSTIQQFDLAATDAVRVVDKLAGAANASIADIADIGVSLKYVGGVANAFGLTFEDTITAISLLAKAGIRGSTAGTSLRQMIVSLGGATGPATKELKKLGIITEDGNNLFFDAEGKVKSLAEVYQILQDHTSDLTAKQRGMSLKTIFNNRALAAAAILTRDGAQGFEEMADAMANTTAADVASKRLDNLSGDIEILKGNIETLLTEQGGPFQEMLRGWTQDITDLVQAFGELNPETQKAIVQFIGLSGAALVALGVFNIIVGTIFRFIANMLKMGAAIAFVWKWLRAVIYLLGIIVGGTISATVAVIIGVVLALAAAFIIAYKKIKVFRDFVNNMASEFNSRVVQPIWEGIKNIGEAFKILVTDPKRAWEAIKKGAVIAAKAIADFARDLPGYFQRGFQVVMAHIGAFISNVGDFFAQLPGRVLGIVRRFMGLLQKIFTFKNLGKAIGLGIKFLVGRFVLLPLLLLRVLLQGLNLLYQGFLQLGPKLGYALGFVIGKLVGLWLAFWATMFTRTAQLAVRLGDFFKSLPGRIGAIMAMAAVKFVEAGRALIDWGITNGPIIIENILVWIRKLPGRVLTILQRLPGKMAEALIDILVAASKFGSDIVEGIMSQLRNLPGLVKGILESILGAFKDLAGKPFELAKNLGGAINEGFKDGIDKNSPSGPEKDMFQMNKTLKRELKTMSRHTVQIQRYAAKTAATDFGITSSSGKVLDTLSRTQAIQKKTAASVATAPKSLIGSTPKQTAGTGAAASRIVAGKLKIDERGQAWIQGLAEDVNASQDQLLSEADRRNRED